MCLDILREEDLQKTSQNWLMKIWDCSTSAPIMCTHYFPVDFLHCLFVYLVPFLNLLLFSNFSPWTFCFLCHKTKFMLVLKQPYYYLYGHSFKEIAKFLNRMDCWVNKWSKSECFQDNPRSRRLSVLNNCARKSVKKEKRLNNSTRKIGQNLQQKNTEISSITVWRYMTRKGWKAFEQKKTPQLSKNKEEPVWDSPRNTWGWKQRITKIFIHRQVSYLQISFPLP